MRVIITGGTGLIGRALAQSLAGDGHEVIVLSRNPSEAGSMPQNVKVVKWDGRTAQGWGNYADGADAIVNLAGASIAGEGFFPGRWTPEKKKAIIESRVNAGKAVVEAVKLATDKPKVVIQSSAIGYYGSHIEGEKVEDSPPGDDFQAKVCIAWEASTNEIDSLGVRRCIIRTAVVLSTKGGALPRMALPFKLFAGGPIGSGKQPFSWIHVEDEVAAIRALIENPDAKGAFNLSAPQSVTNREFATFLGRALKRPSFIPVPGFVFKLLFGEVAAIVLEGQRVVPKRLGEIEFQFRYPDALRALNDIYQNGK